MEEYFLARPNWLNGVTQAERWSHHSDDDDDGDVPEETTWKPPWPK